MSIKVAAWNLHESLAKPKYMSDVVEVVKGFDADVVVLPDAYSLNNGPNGSSQEVLDEAIDIMDDEGYTYLQTEYDDEDRWRHDRNIIVLSRLAFTDIDTIRLGTRNALSAKVAYDAVDTVLDIVGVHFDDRDEFTRLRQAASFIAYSEASFYSSVLLGDLNSANNPGVARRLLNTSSASRIAARIKHPRLNSIATRITEMSSGDSVDLIENAGFVDTDPSKAPTFPAVGPILQLDHIYTPSTVKATNYSRYCHPTLSDHCAIAATLTSVE